jgi:hypothetical protein
MLSWPFSLKENGTAMIFPLHINRRNALVRPPYAPTGPCEIARPTLGSNMNVIRQYYFASPS